MVLVLVLVLAPCVLVLVPGVLETSLIFNEYGITRGHRHKFFKCQSAVNANEYFLSIVFAIFGIHCHLLLLSSYHKRACCSKGAPAASVWFLLPISILVNNWSSDCYRRRSRAEMIYIIVMQRSRFKSPSRRRCRRQRR